METIILLAVRYDWLAPIVAVILSTVLLLILPGPDCSGIELKTEYTMNEIFHCFPKE